MQDSLSLVKLLLPSNAITRTHRHNNGIECHHKMMVAFKFVFSSVVVVVSTNKKLSTLRMQRKEGIKRADNTQ
jgi:hypothetical protein